MSSIFTKIIKGDLPCHKIAENENCFAFLDIMPLKEGHTLVIPKKEIDNLFDLDKQVYGELLSFAYYVAQGIQKAIPCNRVGMTVLGLEVPHAHIHLIPINRLEDMDFTKSKQRENDIKLLETARKIHQFL